MHLPAGLKRVLKRTPLYPAYVRYLPLIRERRARHARYWSNRLRVLRGVPPLPPPALMELVAGNADAEWFERSGRLGAESITDILARNGQALARMEALLDFGCGVGRVLRYWHGVKGPRIHGSDYNPALIEWCRRHLRFAEFNVNPLRGGLPYADGTFDFVYALSVFTHLSDEQQDAWMAELRRVLKKSGHLLISTHGEHYLGALPPDMQETFRAGRTVVLSGEREGTNVCATYHPPSYVRQHLAAGFDVVDFIPEGARGNPWQDYWLLRKATDPRAGS